MSATRRRSKKRKQQSRTGNQRPVPAAPAAELDIPDECGCAACSGDVSPEQMLDELLKEGAQLLATEDPLEAEMLGAMLLAANTAPIEQVSEALSTIVVPALAASGRPEALALLLAIGSVVPEPVASTAADAARALATRGVRQPAWVPELDEPVVAGECWELRHPLGFESILACEFRRGQRSHAVLVTVDDLHCGAADEASLLDGADLQDVVQDLVDSSAAESVPLDANRLDPATFRGKLEAALDSRAVHDEEDPGAGIGPASPDPLGGLFDEDGPPGYPVVAALLRARLAVLPEPAAGKAPHGSQAGAEAARSGIEWLLGQMGGGGPRYGPAELPPQRAKRDGPAPVCQLKVGLRGAKPPIWRRLEVPGDVSLAELHQVIQAAFEWYDGHLHVFETPYGEFGVADRELGHRSEEPVTLEQVAPDQGSTFRYVYDFGDDWDHEVRVEKLLDRQPGATYPRCTGGRRAAPPEDCGGIWGYQDLLAALADPAHPDHDDALELLGLESPDELDPAAFDKHDVTARLPRVR